MASNRSKSPRAFRPLSTAWNTTLAGQRHGALGGGAVARALYSIQLCAAQYGECLTLAIDNWFVLPRSCFEFLSCSMSARSIADINFSRSWFPTVIYSRARDWVLTFLSFMCFAVCRLGARWSHSASLFSYSILWCACAINDWLPCSFYVTEFTEVLDTRNQLLIFPLILCSRSCYFFVIDVWFSFFSLLFSALAFPLSLQAF